MMRAPWWAEPQPPAGILHLHGRIGDDALDLARTEFVLTSADFGDAYLRDGWASREIEDHMRLTTLVLVGYGAEDVAGSAMRPNRSNMGAPEFELSSRIPGIPRHDRPNPTQARTEEDTPGRFGVRTRAIAFLPLW
jgi:hypothetical protein